MLISADNAHGVDLNYLSATMSLTVLLNAGPVIKVNANQRYATNARHQGFYRSLSDRLGLPYRFL
ncbi:MAG: hypothetical protein IPM37_03410 [Hahellaceae bacterium]|nr:hypothetical protein [Hahellaceae bacterium]